MEATEYQVMREAEEQHFWFRGSRAVIFDWIDRALGSFPHPARALDVGAGTGGVLAGLTQRCDAWGAEMHASGARYVAGRSLPVVQAALPKLPFADKSFDLVVSLDVFEHIEDDIAAIAEAARVLRPGGRMITTVPALRWLWSEHDEALHHCRRYHKADFDRALRAGGFEPLRLTYYNLSLLPPIAAVRLASNAVRRFSSSRSTPASDVSIPPAPLNDALATWFGAERHALKRFDLPLGASLIADVRVLRS